MDGLPTYAVNEKDGKWFVRVTKELKKAKTAPMAIRDPNNRTKMLIVGGGAAGLSCAETLRQSQFTGEIQVLSPEKVTPYDKTLLSTNMSKNSTSLRKGDFLDAYGIDYQLGYEVTSIDKYAKAVQLADGARISYDKLLIATGSKYRSRSTEFIDFLNNIHVLRTAQDQE